MAEIDERKAALIAELNRARGQIAQHSQGMRGGVNVRGQVKNGFLRHRPSWMSFAAIIGFALAKFRPRTKKVLVNRGGAYGSPLATTKRGGIFMALLKLALDFAKPLLLAWATKRMGDVVKSSEKVERKVEKVDAKT